MAAIKCQNNRQALDARRGGDVKIGSEIGLERFQAQLSSTQMGNPGLHKITPDDLEAM
jgi:hypothetical protein